MSKGKSSGKGSDKGKSGNHKGLSGDDVIDALDGNDKVNGGAGNDTLAGGSGDDRLVGGSGNDLLDGGGSIVGGVLVALGAADGNDRVDGDAGNDTLVWRPADNQGMKDQYSGGSGWDTLRLEMSAADWTLYQADVAELMQFLAGARRDGKGEVNGGRHGQFVLELGTAKVSLDKIDNLMVVVDGVEQVIPVAPSIYRGELEAEVKEGSRLVDSGRIAFLDLNLADTHTVTTALVGADPALGTLTVTLAEDSTGDGLGRLEWSYTLDDNLVQALGAGDEIEQVYTITITDNTGLSTTREFEIEVHGSNDAPVAVDDAFAVTKNVALVVAAPGVLGNDTDADADALSLLSVDTTGLQGTLVTQPGGGFSFTPTVDFVGVTTFTYQVSDGAGGTDTGLVTLTVG